MGAFSGIGAGLRSRRTTRKLEGGRDDASGPADGNDGHSGCLGRFVDSSAQGESLGPLALLARPALADHRDHDALELAASALAASRPAVVTGAASAITQVSATLHATVNPEGATVTECKLEYGTLLSYGQTAPCVPSPGSGATAVKVSAEASSLSASTEYHYRIVAKNAGGASYGKDKTFKTPSATLSPTVTKLTPSNRSDHRWHQGDDHRRELSGRNARHLRLSRCVDSDCQLAAFDYRPSPKEAAGKMPVTVTTPTGTSSVSTNDYFTFAAPKPPALKITTKTLPEGEESVPYSTTLMATGGTVSGNNPYTWKLSSATSLPPGLYLNETEQT